MYKNVFKLVSVLFVSLFLVTACGDQDKSKNKSTKTDLLKDAIAAAKDAQTKIEAINVLDNANTAAKVRDTAKPLLMNAQDRVLLAYSAIGATNWQSVQSAVTSINDTLVKGANSDADTEKTTMTNLAKALVAALEAAKSK